MTWELVEGDAWQHMASMPADSVDVTICDPPYCSRTHATGAVLSNKRVIPVNGRDKTAHAVDFGFAAFTLSQQVDLVAQLLRVTRRWCLAFCSLEMLAAYRDAAGDRWIRSGVWMRIAPMPQVTGDRPGQGAEGVAIFHRAGRKRWNGGGSAAAWQ